MAWTAPTVLAVSVNVDATQTVTNVPAPVSDTSARSSNPAFNACYEAGNDCVTTGSYGSSALKYDDGATSGGVTLPSWITWNDSTQTLTLAPTTPSLDGTHTIFGTYTPDSGTATQFTVLTITVDCVVTSVTRPSNPTTGLTYELWYSPNIFDFTDGWTQTPNCGTAYSSSFVWTGTNDYI